MRYGLIFDVDGVLADTEPLSTESCSRAFSDLHGVTVPMEDHVPYMGATSRVHVAGLVKKYGLAGADVGALVQAHDTGVVRSIEESDGIEFPGAAGLIAKMAALPEWRLGLGTSSLRARSEATLKAAGIDTNVFTTWICGDDIAAAKPDPEIYLRAATELQLFPTRCVVIEDSIAGVAAAKAAKMYCVAVTHTFGGEHLRAADRIVDRIGDITPTLLYDLVADTA